MGLSDSLKDSYYSLEDKWYDFVEKVSDKVPIFGKVVDSLEEKNIPSFPAAIIFVVLLILILFWLFFLNATLPLTVNVIDAENEAVVGATVIVMAGEAQVAMQQTSVEGKAIFALGSGTYNIKVEKEGYSTQTQSVEAGKETTIGLELADLATKKAVYMKTSDGKMISGAGTVKYFCKGSDEPKTAFYQDGKFDAEFNDECTEIEIESISGYKVVTGSASFSGGSVTVEKQEVNTGSVRVILQPTAEIPAGLRVVLTAEDNVPEQIKYTETGTVLFENIPTKKYYITVSDLRTDASTKYTTYDGKNLGNLKEVTKDATTEFEITLDKTVSRKLIVTVKDVDSMSSILGAEVKLGLTSNGTTLETKVSGSTGQVIFDVAADQIYNITVEHPEYIIGSTRTVQTTENEVLITLVKATAENSQSLLVSVVDGEGKPVDKAKVVLKAMDNSDVDNATTNSEGQTEFYNLQIGQYYAYVAKDNFASANSQSVQIVPRRQSTLEVKLQIGKGDIRLRVLDPEKNPINGAVVKAINYYTLKIEDQKMADSEGLVEFNLREDKYVYFTVEAPTFLNYTTAVMNADDSSTKERDVVMFRDNGKLQAEIVSLEMGGLSLPSEEKDRSVGVGVYTGRAVVTVPKGSFSEAGLHIRTGKATEGITNLMEEDNSKITSIVSSANKTTKGTTYSPPSGYDKDAKNLTSGEAKWVNSVWRNPSQGVYEVEFDLTITDVNPTQGINLWYRAWTKGGSTLRDPASTLSGNNELYSLAKNHLLTGGATSLCTNGICKSYTALIMSGNDEGKKLYLTNTLNAKKDIVYQLNAELINTGRAIPGAVLTIDTAGLDVSKISVNGAEYTNKIINLGSLGADSFTQLSITFTPKGAGTAPIKFAISSSTKTEWEDTLNVVTKANKKFTLNLIPKEIIPYVTNTLFFEVMDGNTPLSGVLLEIKNGNDVLDTVETTSEGIATYELASPSVGDEITITASKEGYDIIEMTKKVDKSILLITPPQINETIKIGEIKSISQTILMQNASVKDVKVRSVEFGGELKSYLDLKFADTIIGTTIEVGKDKNYALTIKPNSIGSKLQSPKSITGEMTINTEVEGTKQLFESSIPITIRLSMPGYIDSDKCLKATPNTLTFTSAAAESVQTIELQNTCTAEGVELNLHNIEAKLNMDSKLGSVMISGEGISGTLTSGYVKVGEMIEKNSKNTITVRFLPNSSVSSGTQDVTITFKGDNIPSEDEKESVETNVKASISMSNLNKCVEIEKPEGGLILDVAGWNLGYNNIINSNLGAYAQQYQGFNNKHSSMPYGMTSALPFMSQSGQSQGSQSTAQYDASSFIVKNNCATAIEIDLDPDSRLNVSEEKFVIEKDSDNTVQVTSGYTLGRFTIKVNARAADTEESKKKIGDVSVTVRKLGQIDKDCIKVNTAIINLNSFIYKPQRYKAYNYCYDTGVMISTGNRGITIQCDAPNQITQTGYGGAMMPVANPEPYFQMGMEGMYGNSYPLNNVYNSYYDYLTPQGCQGNQCAMVTGTRVYSQQILGGEGSGAIEEVTFEVMPSASYMPQRKLFNNQSGQYGAFQSIGDFRQWATETDARTNIYGNINVEYSNQYGSTQCMSFPVEIKDSWRLLESLDSAINWGDPNARPSECISNDAKENSFNIYKYWLSKGNNKGAIPDSEYRNNGVYLHLPNPPAVNIGPAPNQTMGTQYPYNTWYTQNKDTSGKAKNCGLLDELSDIKYQNNFAGAIINVEETSKGGSIISNTKGPNLMIEINRSGMTSNCVYIDTVIRANLRRMNNFDTQEVSWNLKALVAKPGYKIQTSSGNLTELGKECVTAIDSDKKTCDEYLRAIIASTPEKDRKLSTIQERLNKEHSECTRYYTDQTIQDMMKPSTAVYDGCTTEYKKFGFDLIGKTTAEEVTTLEYDNYCENNFCNKDMLEIFLRKRISKIKEVNYQCPSTNNTVTINELYKTAKNTGLTLKECNGPLGTGNTIKFYTADNGSLITTAYTIPKEITDKYPTQIENIKKGKETNTPAGFSDMAALLEEVNSTTDGEILVKITKTELPETVWKENTNKNLTLFMHGIYEVGDKYYMPIKNLKLLNEEFSKNPADGNINAYCGFSTNLKIQIKDSREIESLKWIYSNIEGFVRGIKVDGKETPEEIQKIYNAYPDLNKIKNLADVNAYITQVDTLESTTLSDDLASKKGVKEFMNDKYDLNYNSNENTSIDTLTSGRYNIKIDMNLCAKPVTADPSATPAIEGKVVDVNVIIVEIKEDALELVSKNIILQKGFASEAPKNQDFTLSAEGVLLEGSQAKINVYSRTPIKLTATLYGGEDRIVYQPIGQAATTAGTTLISWYDNGQKKTDEKVADGSYVYSLGYTSLQPKTIVGLYYAPNSAGLVFKAGNFGGEVNAVSKISGVSVSPAKIILPKPREADTGAMEVGVQEIIDLTKVVEYVKTGKACISTDGQKITWNEKELMK